MLRDLDCEAAQSYLPEQLYLAGKLTGWRHISEVFNMEIGHGGDDPRLKNMRSAAFLVRDAKVWHYSGTGAQPYMFLDLPGGADAVKHYMVTAYADQDPHGVLALVS